MALELFVPGRLCLLGEHTELAWEIPQTAGCIESCKAWLDL